MWHSSGASSICLRLCSNRVQGAYFTPNRTLSLAWGALHYLVRERGVGQTVGFGSRADPLDAAEVANGRVEDGRGSWGPTGHHPVSHLRSSNRTSGVTASGSPTGFTAGPRQNTSRQAFKTQKTKLPVNNFTREPASSAPCHFVSSREKVAHALVGIAVNAAEC